MALIPGLPAVPACLLPAYHGMTSRPMYDDVTTPVFMTSEGELKASPAAYGGKDLDKLGPTNSPSPAEDKDDTLTRSDAEKWQCYTNEERTHGTLTTENVDRFNAERSQGHTCNGDVSPRTHNGLTGTLGRELTGTLGREVTGTLGPDVTGTGVGTLGREETSTVDGGRREDRTAPAFCHDNLASMIGFLQSELTTLRQLDTSLLQQLLCLHDNVQRHKQQVADDSLSVYETMSTCSSYSMDGIDERDYDDVFNSTSHTPGAEGWGDTGRAHSVPRGVQPEDAPGEVYEPEYLEPVCVRHRSGSAGGSYLAATQCSAARAATSGEYSGRQRSSLARKTPSPQGWASGDRTRALAAGSGEGLYSYANTLPGPASPRNPPPPRPGPRPASPASPATRTYKSHIQVYTGRDADTRDRRSQPSPPGARGSHRTPSPRTTHPTQQRARASSPLCSPGGTASRARPGGGTPVRSVQQARGAVTDSPSSGQYRKCKFHSEQSMQRGSSRTAGHTAHVTIPMATRSPVTTGNSRGQVQKSIRSQAVPFPTVAPPSRQQYSNTINARVDSPRGNNHYSKEVTACVEDSRGPSRDLGICAVQGKPATVTVSVQTPYKVIWFPPAPTSPPPPNASYESTC